MDKGEYVMAVHKYKKFDLHPKRKTMKDKALEFFLEHHALIVFAVMGVVFLLTLMVLQSQAQADFMMHYGSGY